MNDEEHKQEISPFDLFNNPMVESAKKTMSPEMLEKYKKLGESLYGDVQYENSKVDNKPPPMVEALAYVSELLKSGLHPSMLDENEKAFMSEVHGEEWYKLWGYVEKDLTEIFTIKSF